MNRELNNVWNIEGTCNLAPPIIETWGKKVKKVENNKVSDTEIVTRPIIRSDKKHDIRIPVNEEEKRWVRLMAVEYGMSMTQFTTSLVKKSLSNHHQFVNYPYYDSNNIIHVKLDNETYKELVKVMSLLNCSIRKATYIVFKHMLTLQT
ncbi:hypothetical protein [Salinibacillus xinjiangensis]|uniref:Uncharacterized protein n=1 Tax=Salinibacillus xinjiangensis TaxID=1229268 RepID=A0A6G1X740_9BACI|nr:hypothetical protein [Salinibacillus xinjiangensis]MRG86725.1 hypothetical protein [Salinibacillus xinjiangensis]